MTAQQTDTAVRRSISVRAGVERAFQAFTAEMDHWWPRDHHIGSGTPKKAWFEGRLGGRCYTEYTDGSECDWGEVILWEPPHRLVVAWLIDANWRYDPDRSRTSEFEVHFTPQADGTTRVDLEHRNFERMGEAGSNMRMMVGSKDGGWGALLTLFAAWTDQGEVQ